MRGARVEEYRFRKLIVWQRAVELAAAVHRGAAAMRGRDRADLADQMRRAALSIPANIAEGNGRRSRADYLRFLGIAAGSLAELESHVELAERLCYLRPDSLSAIKELQDHTARLLTRLIQALREQGASAPSSRP